MGVVVKDRYGNLAAATSSGGTTDRLHHQPDASAIVGAGLFADNARGAAVALGPSHILQIKLPAFAAAAEMAAGRSPEEAAVNVTAGALARGPGALVALHPNGEAHARVFGRTMVQLTLQADSAASPAGE